jgi:ATP-dependent 26S proteasome regulatory subunit
MTDAAGAALEIGNPLHAAVSEVRFAIAALRGGTRWSSPVDLDPVWRKLLSVFRLDRVDRDVLVTTVALLAEPALAVEFEGLADRALPARRHVTAPLVARLFAHEPALVWREAGAAALWGLVCAEPVAPGEPAALIADPIVAAWLCGDFRVDRLLAGIVHTESAQAVPETWPVAAAAAAVRASFAAKRPVRLAVKGPPGSGRAAFAKAVAATLGMPPLIADMSKVAREDGAHVLTLISRFAAAAGCAVIWRPLPDTRWLSALTGPAPLQCVAVDAGEALAPDAALDTLTFELPELTIAERRATWLALIPAAANWPEPALRQLSARDRLGYGEIECAARQGGLTPESVRAHLRASRRISGESHLSAIDCPYDWDDLVLPPLLRLRIEEFAFEAIERGALFEEDGVRRLFPRRYGLVALFAGPPGTGKTMAAQVIAHALDVELLRVDLAAVVSKYIGETAKNLSAIFEHAKRSDAILFFDEADALFSQRTEVKDSNDRYANADTNHLLQLIETHNHGGAVILATNRPSDIDPAFRRRLRFAFNFPKPGRTEQIALWRRALGDVTPDRAPLLDEFAQHISGEIDLTGAQIKAAVLTSLFAARRARAPLDTSHLAIGVERELEKEGRDLSSAQRQRWSDHVR